MDVQTTWTELQLRTESSEAYVMQHMLTNCALVHAIQLVSAPVVFYDGDVWDRVSLASQARDTSRCAISDRTTSPRAAQARLTASRWK